MIAMALACRPDIPIADEPTPALDLSIRTRVLDLLLRLQAEMGRSFIFISHDMAVIRYFCDRVAVMYRGKIVEIGETEQIIDNPQHPAPRRCSARCQSPIPSLRGTRQRHHYQPAGAQDHPVPFACGCGRYCAPILRAHRPAC
ncbi:hypothetical protein [Meridianimarinicoccus marinus]